MRIVTFSQEAPIHRYIFHTFHHSANVKDTRRASSCICTVGWTSSTSYHIANASADGIYILLRRYHMYMGIKMTWGTYGMLASSSLSACRDYQVRRSLYPLCKDCLHFQFQQSCHPLYQCRLLLCQVLDQGQPHS